LTCPVSYEQFVEMWMASFDRRPPLLRRPLVALALTWAFIALLVFLTVPIRLDDPGAVARAVVITLVAALWWWGWFEMSDRVQRWLLGRPEFGDLGRALLFMTAFALYPVVSIAVLMLVY